MKNHLNQSLVKVTFNSSIGSHIQFFPFGEYEAIKDYANYYNVSVDKVEFTC
ncbi:hypothetical protein KDN24_06335 [Bacillus sp. Bva_UNVM-123]|uniref:hypothetical protein n=1 Tax=Bacillus sp. Bva_UNVM-123 TaxID=2829798 RepID=UPI00391EF5CA